MTVSLHALNICPDSEFVETLSGIFEHSPWVAESVAGDRPFESVSALHRAMVAAIDDAGSGSQLKLICAHPDLAGKAALAGEITAESTSEQKGAGLDRLSGDEFERFHALNDAYKARFGFPFILAVRGHDKNSIMEAFERRLRHSQDEEMTEALAQIARIGELRLNHLIEE